MLSLPNSLKAGEGGWGGKEERKEKDRDCYSSRRPSKNPEQCRAATYELQQSDFTEPWLQLHHKWKMNRMYEWQGMGKSEQYIRW